MFEDMPQSVARDLPTIGPPSLAARSHSPYNHQMQGDGRFEVAQSPAGAEFAQIVPGVFDMTGAREPLAQRGREMFDTGIERLRRVLELYAQGAYTILEVRNLVMVCASATNLDALVKMLPPEVLCSVHEHIDESPRTDEDWKTLRLVEISGAHPGRIEPPDEAEMEQGKKDYRQKIELMRDYFEKEG